MDWSIWGPPLVVLAIGVMLGMIVAMRLQVSKAGLAEEREDALLARKENVLEQLRELENDRSKLEEGAYAAERARLVEAAADVLRELDQPREEDEEPPSAPAGLPLRRLVQGTAVVAVAGVTVVMLTRFAVPRQEMPDAPVATAPAAVTERDALLADARAALAANPDDVEAANLLAHYAILDQQLSEAMQYLDVGRRLAPDDPEVKVHLSALRIMVGMLDDADEALTQVLYEQPNHAEALIWKGAVHFQRGEVPAAREALERVLAHAQGSEEAYIAQGILADSDASGGMAAAGATGSSAAPSAQAPSSASGPARVTGRVVLADGLTAPEGTLFVFARASPEERGPPLAAVRVPSWQLPLDFQLGDGDLIRGGDWPDQVWLAVRISTGGDPMTRGEGDLASAIIGPIQPGQEGVELVLGGS